jgi:hypothetical protein
MTRIFSLQLSEHFKVAVYVPHPGRDPEKDVDVDKTFGFRRRGAFNCCHFRWAHRTCSGRWQRMEPVVAVLPGEDGPANPDNFAPMPGPMVQRVLNNPKALLESILWHNLLPETESLFELHVPRRYALVAARFAASHVYQFGWSWLRFECRRFSYTADVVVDYRGASRQTIATVPKWVVSHMEFGRGVTHDPNTGWIATPNDKTHCRVWWRYYPHQDKEVWYVWEERPVCGYIGWERCGEHFHAACRMDPEYLPWAVEEYRLGDLLIVPESESENEAIKSSSDSWPFSERLAKLTLLGAELRGMRHIQATGAAPVVYHPEHGTLHLKPGVTYVARAVKYGWRGHD